MGNTVLITGVMGQDGSLLAEYLAGLGHEIVGIARDISSGLSGEARSVARLASVDITDEGALGDLLSEVRPSRIFHLAAFHHSSQQSGGSGVLDAWNQMVRVNFQSTCALAYATLKAVPEAHLVFSASSQMFTPRDLQAVVDETTPREPATFYGHAKSFSMDMLAFLRRHKRLHASTAILFNHESTRRGAQFVTRKITRMAAAAKRGLGGRLELFNIGARVDWSAAEDVVHAMHLMAESDVADDYVVASGLQHSVRDVLDVAFGHVQLDWRDFVEYREDTEAPSLVGCPAKIEKALGWRRHIDFETMIRRMVDADLATGSDKPSGDHLAGRGVLP